MRTRANHWNPAVYMSCMIQNFTVSLIEFIRYRLSCLVGHVHGVTIPPPAAAQTASRTAADCALSV